MPQRSTGGGALRARPAKVRRGGARMSDIVLPEVTADDLPIFFEQQRDPDANYMAAFTAKDPADRNAYVARWTRILGDASVIWRTTLFEGRVAGSVSSYEDAEEGGRR